ncbi:MULTISPECIES: DNA-binding protein [Acidiphilium]|jgi:predicted transcriptional regulator|uniref:Ribbon-helix-helix protein, copG family n=1 Tax=Acidiphilium rubrum TaxID=526 RepID=A0A8G2FDH6_ACIRU|nr:MULTISPECIES: DNA-binding protein [Acidiphilium]MBW4037069.1 DNA-binding protein [Pseudomonadota bacterium]OYW00426.1 MAG: DNA-binding protein [Acidiphilium sp. 37-64-53]OZB25644.1 MAG: DNA-binding protein [Acidiphilium sp. 34-64-41]SIQ84681.1 hypothetical protein SAMN05421828_11098 [Acidiphilium rubrum]HQT86502.1 hypothetical protein [Acidiphilium rubrum]
MAEKVRLNLLVSPELNDRLDTIAASAGATKTDVIRQAIALMEVAHQAKRESKHIGIASDRNKLETEFVGLL